MYLFAKEYLQANVPLYALLFEDVSHFTSSQILPTLHHNITKVSTLGFRVNLNAPLKEWPVWPLCFNLAPVAAVLPMLSANSRKHPIQQKPEIKTAFQRLLFPEGKTKSISCMKLSFKCSLKA